MTNDISKIKEKFQQLFLNKYKFGFKTNIKNYQIQKGINTNIIKQIVFKKKEDQFFLHFRLEAFKSWLKLKEPIWANLIYKKINYQKIVYFSTPNINNNNVKITKTFKKLGISLNSKKNVATDAIFDSVSVFTTFKKKLAKTGIIFCSLSEAVIKYPYLVKKFLGTTVPKNDNFFSALNSSIFSDGSFCYIPQNTICPIDLASYFRINNKNLGQFERTLIIVEKNSFVNYIEACTAPKYIKNQLHAAVVELIAFEKAKIKYSTIQNWYSGNVLGLGGVLNFVTKRGLCLGQESKISWTQIETGSSSTWKYPSCILAGAHSFGEFFSITLTKNKQQSDTGTKMIHLGQKTKSKIISKSISADFSKNTYRGLVKISKNAYNSKNISECDSFLIGPYSKIITFPVLDIKNQNSTVEHEAKISKISEEQLFYLMQRGISFETSINILINGFCKEIFKTLPREFLLDAQSLLNIKFDKNIG